MPILPLPQFEADLEADRKVYEALKTPKTLVVRFGVMKLVGEFSNDSGAKPGCGSKLVVRTHRGTEIGEMLTSTCPNSGCSKSVSRQDMLKYVENSGGRDYPFFQEGRVLRVATTDDMLKQEQLEQSRHGLRTEAKRVVEEMGIPIKIVDAEPILGNERLFMYFYSEERVDLRDLAPRLSRMFHNRVELRQVGARDEARITADYERCGQYCCCKNFLKVLKPISMKSAKIQKATLDPLKISGRCGRLMCCLRYEDETYESLRKKLPRKKSRVGTPEGDGFVVDTQILTQLVLVQLDIPEPDGKIRQAAIPVENLSEPVSKVQPPPEAYAPPPYQRSGPRPGPGDRRGGPPAQSPPPARDAGGAPRGDRTDRPRDDRPRDDRPPQGRSNDRSSRPPQPGSPGGGGEGGGRGSSERGGPDRGPSDRGPRPQGPSRRPDGPRRPSNTPGAPQGGPQSAPARGPSGPQGAGEGPHAGQDGDDFGPGEIDDLMQGSTGIDEGGEAPGGQGPGGPDSGQRRRKRRRRRGRGGGPGNAPGGGPDGPQGPGPAPSGPPGPA